MFGTKKKLSKEQASALIFDAVFDRALDIMDNKDKRGLASIDEARILLVFLSVYMFIFLQAFQFPVDSEEKKKIFCKAEELVMLMMIQLYGISMDLANDMVSHVHSLLLEYNECVKKFEGRGDEVCKWEVAKCAAGDLMEGDEGEGDRYERFIAYNSICYEEITTYLKADVEKLNEFTLV